ncbi:MAG: protein kinase [Planctomycetes bacterium]|nr:protein kinase [Planctomycetota bacterium]
MASSPRKDERSNGDRPNGDRSNGDRPEVDRPEDDRTDDDRTQNQRSAPTLDARRVTISADIGWNGSTRETAEFMLDSAPRAAAAIGGASAVGDESLRDTAEFVLDFPALVSPRVGDVFHRYQIEGEIASGAMGSILKGKDTQLGREIAFKFLLEEYRGNKELRERFMQEARITARLQHPGIVPVYEFHQLPDQEPFFTMRLVHGRSLKDLLRERAEPSQDLPRFLGIFEKVCQTLAYAHSEGVIHRDLKPSNIMVAEFGVVHVMDWGLAKVVGPGIPAPESGLHDFPEPSSDVIEDLYEDPQFADRTWSTVAGRVLGTPAYMPPEQARGEVARLDKRADVFGLGAILCVILTGRPPYVGKNGAEIYRKAVKAKLKDATARLDACRADPELIALAKRCLAVKPKDRPNDAREIAQVVTAYLETHMQRAERDLVRFFELSLDLFCLASLDGYFRRVNGNFSRVLGYTEEELLTRPFLDFVHPGDRQKTLDKMAQLSRGLPVVRFQNRYRNVRGKYRWFEWTAKSIPEEGVIFAVARDVTDRIQFEEQLRAISR